MMAQRKNVTRIDHAPRKRNLYKVDTRRNHRGPGAATYCMILAELPTAEYSRHQAQRLRAELIREGLTWPSTYVSRVILPDGTPVWRIALPW